MRLINEDDVLRIVERVTNEAVEKNQRKYLIQPRIIAEIAGLPTIEAEPDNGWISVKDRLPPTGVPVLIYVYNIEEMTVVSLDHDGLGFSNDDEWFNIKNIHHWRTLPEPPKGE